ncbi:hypothetical protein ACWD5F_03580 [Streptomyces sp. NPDC002499]
MHHGAEPDGDAVRGADEAEHAGQGERADDRLAASTAVTALDDAPQQGGEAKGVEEFTERQDEPAQYQKAFTAEQVTEYAEIQLENRGGQNERGRDSGDLRARGAESRLNIAVDR